MGRWQAAASDLEQASDKVLALFEACRRREREEWCNYRHSAVYNFIFWEKERP